MYDKRIRQKLHQIDHLTKRWIATGGEAEQILSQMKTFLAEAQQSGLTHAEHVLDRLISQLSHPPTSDAQTRLPDQAA